MTTRQHETTELLEQKKTNSKTPVDPTEDRASSTKPITEQSSKNYVLDARTMRTSFLKDFPEDNVSLDNFFSGMK